MSGWVMVRGAGTPHSVTLKRKEHKECRKPGGNTFSFPVFLLSLCSGLSHSAKLNTNRILNKAASKCFFRSAWCKVLVVNARKRSALGHLSEEEQLTPHLRCKQSGCDVGRAKIRTPMAYPPTPRRVAARSLAMLQTLETYRFVMQK